MRFILIVVCIIVFIKVLSVTSFFSSVRVMPDFDTYYHLVSDIRDGQNPYTVSYMQSLGPPLVFLYYLPFSFVSLPMAQTFFLIMNILAGYLLAVVLAYKYFPKKKILAFLILSLVLYSSFLSRYSLQIGQPILLIALLISIQAVPLLITLKTFFAFTLLARPKNVLTGLIIFCSFLIIRPDWYTYYFQNKFIQNISVSENENLLNYENQTLRSTSARLKIQKAYPYTWLGLAVLGVLLVTKTRNFNLGVLFSFLVSPVLWQHYFIALFPVFVSVFCAAKTKIAKLLLGISFVLWWPDLRFLHTAPTTLPNGLFASHFYLSLVLLTITVLVNLRHELFGNRFR